VFAEVRYENDGPDAQCNRYASRPAPDYHGDVDTAAFTFNSSRPYVASVTKSGLVAVHQGGETDIIAISGTAYSRPLRITTSIVPPPP
jgi:Big-like domain-containing protein